MITPRPPKVPWERHRGMEPARQYGCFQPTCLFPGAAVGPTAREHEPCNTGPQAGTMGRLSREVVRRFWARKQSGLGVKQSSSSWSSEFRERTLYRIPPRGVGA